MAVQHLTEKDFDAATKTGVALIDFWAPWCGPCRMLGPVIDELANEMGDKAVFAKVNCDEEAGLAQKFSVRSIPAVFILKDGKVVDQLVGVRPKTALAAAITKALAG